MQKRLCSMMIVLAMLLSLIPQTFAEYTDSGMLELFVDSKASGGDGSFASPFSSFEEARDYIRSLKANGQYPAKGVTVNFRGGTYYLNEGLKLTAEDSGTEEAPIIYRSYGNETAEFLGGANLNVSDFKPVKTANPEVLDRIDSSLQEKIKVLDLHDYGLSEYGKLQPGGWTVNWYSSNIFPNSPRLDEIAEWMGYTPNLSAPELFADGASMTLARYPNGDELSTAVSYPDMGYTWDEWNWYQIDDYENVVSEKDGPMIAWEDMKGVTIEGDTEFKDRVKRWTKAPDIWSFGYWSYNWASLDAHVRSVDPVNGTITLQHPLWQDAANVGQQFYVYNLLEELDQPGEWYLERETGKLYFYPPKSDTKEIQISLLEESLLSLNNVSNVTIKKMDFSLGRKNAVDLINCNNVTIELCNMGLLGAAGIKFSGDCRNNIVVSNYLYDLNNGGISTSGGNSATLEHADNIVENNIISNFSKGGSQAGALALGGVGDVGRHNKIYGSKLGGILGCSGPYTVLEYNDVFDVMSEANDAGIVYDYQSVAVPGKEIRYNYFHDIHPSNALVMGVYVDGMGHAHTVTGNVFENVDAFCIWFNGGWKNAATDNIFINCKSEGRYTSIGAQGGEGLAHEQNQVNSVKQALENPAYKQFTWLQEWLDAGDNTRMIPQQNVFKNNIRINTEEFLYASYSSISESEVVDKNEIEKSLAYDGDPGFENMAQGNYTLKEDSEVFQKLEDFNAPEFKKMGLYTPWLAYKLKGTLALAIDSQTAYQDFNATYIDANDRTVVPKIIDDVTYLPIRFIAENNGGDVDFDDNSGKATILLNGNEMVIDLKAKTITVNDELLEGMAPIVQGGRSLIPVRTLEAMGKTVTWYGEQRLVIISDEEAVLEQDETNLLNELKRRLS